jgi:glyoxylase-like metal-dependent hydrolase (beta-lactamase superfamily II)
VIRSVHRVAGPDITDVRDCCVYLIDADAPVLIDAGFGDGIDKTIENIRRAGTDPASVRSIVLTHCHIDHVGAARRLRDALGATLYMHRLDAEIVERGDTRLTAAFCFEMDFVPLRIDVKLCGLDGSIPGIDEDILFLHTPGHTPGSISPYVDVEGSRILFGQDLGAPLLPEFDCDPAAWRLSVDRLLALKADVLCDGHSGICRPASRVEAYIRRLIRIYSRKV